MALSEPVLSGPGAGRTVTYGGGSSAELKLAGEQSGGDWAVVEWRVRAGDEPPMYTHTREDDTLHVVEGAITAYVGEEKIEVEAGSYAALPKNVPHAFTVRSEQVRLLVTVEPAVAQQRGRRLRFSVAEAKLRWRTERDRCSGDQDRGERSRGDPVAEHGVGGHPQ